MHAFFSHLDLLFSRDVRRVRPMNRPGIVFSVIVVNTFSLDDYPFSKYLEFARLRRYLQDLL